MPSLHARGPRITEELLRAINEPGESLAPAALAIARMEYPTLDTGPYLQRLDRMGEAALGRLQRPEYGPDRGAQIAILNAYLYEELGFSGNRKQYDDPRNSFLNEVLDRRTGIPISLAIIYLEVGRRAGVPLEGVNFPGHFLIRASASDPAHAGDDLIIDPFHSGALLSEIDCRRLLREHVGEEAAFHRALLATATRQHIVVRMLVNLKRLYVRMRSFPQARIISDLLLAVDPSALSELRDRGLLAYHMEDFAAALRDLEAYLRMMPKSDATDTDSGIETEDSDSSTSESAQIWEHVKMLRRRVAGFN